MRRTSRAKGFTLIELIVITPMIILLVGALVAITIQASTSALRANARAQLQHDVLSALDMIEQDVRLSKRISKHQDGFINTYNFATDVNPLNPDRRLIRKSDCVAVSGSINPEDAVEYWRSYWVSGSQLVRRAYFGAGRWCNNGEAATRAAVWQEHEQLEILIENATLTLDLDYANPATPEGVLTVSLTARRTVAGQEISYTGSLYVQSGNASVGS